MKNGKIKVPEVEVPAIEISVRMDGAELAVCSFFDAGANAWDVLVGVSDTRDREPVALALLAAAEAIRAAAFKPIVSPDHERSDNPPW